MILSNEIYNSSQLRGSVGHAVTDTRLLELLRLISSDTAAHQFPFPFLPVPEYLRTLGFSESKGRVTVAEGSGKAAPICLITHLIFYLCTFLLFGNIHDASVKSCFLCLRVFFFFAEIWMTAAIRASFTTALVTSFCWGSTSHVRLLFLWFLFFKLQVEGNPA